MASGRRGGGGAAVQTAQQEPQRNPKEIAMIMSLPCFNPTHGNKIRVTNKKVSGKQPDIAGSKFFCMFGKRVSGLVPLILPSTEKIKEVNVWK